MFEEVTSSASLFQAWEEFKKEKRKKLDVGQFEKNLETNIFDLQRQLLNKTYKHSDYFGFYIRDPKVRHIHKATVKDRIIHHALFKVLNPIFEPTFVYHSYSCRKGKGTHLGFKRLAALARRLSKNYTQDCWALKCDIKKFFDSVDHQILLAIIESKVKDPDLIWLIKEIIQSYHTEPSKGIPIGNLTSQLFANVYLNQLDQFIKQKLKVKYYLRYADDFILLSPNKELLTAYLNEINLFLEQELKLSLHPNKIQLRKLSWGIDFLGYVALPYHQVIRTKTKKRIFRKVKEKVGSFNENKIEETTLNQSLQSYLGILTHANAYKLEQSLRNNIFFWQNT